jgi:hypothetical protein
MEDAVMKRNLWPLAMEAAHALGTRYEPALEETAAAAGLERPAWTLLLPALTFDPKPISAERLRVRGPYTSIHSYETRLLTLARQGLLKFVGRNDYRLTYKGRETVQHLLSIVYTEMSALKPLLPAELDRLAFVLCRLVDASLAAPEPPSKWSLALSRRIDPGEDAPVVVRIDHYLSDLNGYRDDAHLAAWRRYGVSGPAWEAFTLIWRDEARSLDQLWQRLEWRGHSRAVYAEAIDQLTGRRWLEMDDGQYRLTADGQMTRQEAEDITDRYVYRPWATLTEDECQDIERLLTQLHDALA